MKRFVIAILLIPLTLSLINSDVFGSPSFFSFFFYQVFSGVVAAGVFLGLLFYRGEIKTPPLHILMFLLLSAYISINGFIRGEVNFTSYYWLNNGLFLITSFLLVSTSIYKYVTTLHFLVSALAILESLMVFSQIVGLLPVANNSFWCTGSWYNPNVTAMFLSLSLFSVITFSKKQEKKVFKHLFVVVVFTAILALYCRTAYIVSMIFIADYYRHDLIPLFKRKVIFNLSFIGFLTALLIALLVFISPFINKQKSLSARVEIWNNSTHLIFKKPLTGLGYGKFEKEYNLYTADNEKEVNSHINMAYNDFLELSVEGGIPAVLIWICFLYAFFVFCRKKGTSILPILAICIIQLTNFGFQAYPVFILFIIYISIGNMGIISVDEKLEKNKSHYSQLQAKTIVGFMFLSALLLLIKTGEIVGNYYKQKLVHGNPKNPLAITYFQKIEPVLKFSNGFYENYGDIYMARRLYKESIDQYKKALASCSRPNVFAKCGYCYLMQNRFDSSQYFYKMVEKIEPKKLIPKMALLQLYEKMKDTVSIRNKAIDIVELPMNIVTKRGIEIKTYADNVIKRIDSIRANANFSK